jgi:hypothetical protein
VRRGAQPGVRGELGRAADERRHVGGAHERGVALEPRVGADALEHAPRDLAHAPPHAARDVVDLAGRPRSASAI